MDADQDRGGAAPACGHRPSVPVGGGACWSQGPAGPQPVTGAAHSFVGDVYVLTVKVCQTTPEAAGCSGRTLGLSCPFLGSAGLFAPGSRRPLRPPPLHQDVLSWGELRRALGSCAWGGCSRSCLSTPAGPRVRTHLQGRAAAALDRGTRLACAGPFTPAETLDAGSG